MEAGHGVCLEEKRLRLDMQERHREFLKANELRVNRIVSVGGNVAQAGLNTGLPKPVDEGFDGGSQAGGIGEGR
ncbi:MAG: hypothetical protein U1E33_08455 [Rhodospirillales bacterium]